MLELDRAKAALTDAIGKQPDLSLTSFEEMLEKMNPSYKKCILNGLRKAGLPD